MIKTAIIEDHVDFRESLQYVINSTEGFTCTGVYESVEAALTSLGEADVLLLDINLPGISGIEGIPLLKQKLPGTFILILTVFEDEANIFQAILNGADGYILKKTPPLKILQAIEDASMGGAPMTPVIAKRTLELFKEHVSVKGEEYALSARELEVLSFVVEGMNNNDISAKLFISIQTVRNHIRHIYEKLHVHTKSQAVAKAIKERIV